MVNRALYRRARPVPAAAPMHDFWLVLVAAALGHVHYIDRPTILYRQHGGNLLGAPRRGYGPTALRAMRILLRNSQGRAMERLSEQAEVLLTRYSAEMRPERRRAAMALATIWSANRWTRFSRLHRAGVRRPGLLRAAALCITVTKHGARARRRATEPAVA
jgi:hypothetical protein